MSMYDSFNTLFLSNDENFEGLLKEFGWEALVCDKEMPIIWHFNIEDPQKNNLKT